MATSESIRIDAQLLAGVQIDQATCFRILREHIPHLVEQHFRAGKLVREEFETKEKWELYEPERKLVLIDRVIDKNHEQTVEYSVTNEGLIVYDKGKYLMLYYSQPDLPQTEFHEIDMPSAYTAGLKFFVAARMRGRHFGQQDESAISFYKEYTAAMDEAERFMNRREHRRKRMPPGRRTV